MVTRLASAWLRTVLLILARPSQCGFSDLSWRRLIYDSADQYRCHLSNSRRPDQAARNTARSSYDQYATARRAIDADRP